MAVSRDLSGHKLGNYELLEVIGWGGMGVVYRARQPVVDRDVAIKLVAEPYAERADLVERFEQEALASARLQHPNILPVYDVGFEGSQPYLVMAYMPGGTLGTLISENPAGLPLARTVQIVGEIASAVDYAHDEGIVHRDIKPGNVFFDAHGHAYLGDFGIALLPSIEDQGAHPPVGTYAYLAPEVAKTRISTPASDIYSLAVVVFEMLAGQRPFQSIDLDGILEEQREHGLPDIRAYRPDLLAGAALVIQQAMAWDPAARPPRASALAAALGHVTARSTEAGHGHNQPNSQMDSLWTAADSGQPVEEQWPSQAEWDMLAPVGEVESESVLPLQMQPGQEKPLPTNSHEAIGQTANGGPHSPRTETDRGTSFRPHSERRALRSLDLSERLALQAFIGLLGFSTLVMFVLVLVSLGMAK